MTLRADGSGYSGEAMEGATPPAGPAASVPVERAEAEAGMAPFGVLLNLVDAEAFVSAFSIRIREIAEDLRDAIELVEARHDRIAGAWTLAQIDEIRQEEQS